MIKASQVLAFFLPYPLCENVPGIALATSLQALPQAAISGS
jgi:hypothetical protein